MVGVEYGNSKVRVAYSRSIEIEVAVVVHGNSCSGYSTARFYSAPDYFQRQ